MTLINAVIFLCALAGFIALALAMPKHSKHLLGQAVSPATARCAGVLGCMLLALACALSVEQWRMSIGLVTWLGWLTVAAVIWVFYLPQWPWQPDVTGIKPRKHKESKSVLVTAVESRQDPYKSVLRVLLGTTLLVVPLFGFIWKLLKALG